MFRYLWPVFLFFAFPVQALELRTMVGYAYAENSDELLYIEKHQRWFEGEQIRQQQVSYTTPEGEEFASKVLSFPDGALRPQFALRDQRNGYVETLQESADGYVVGAIKGKTRRWREKQLSNVDFIADAGFDRLIAERWDDLMAGEVVDLPFLVPALLKTVGFQLRKIEQTADTVTFRMQADSFFIRLLAKPIDCRYDLQSRDLVYYEGLSNLRNERLKNFSVRIKFPAEERQRAEITKLSTVNLPTLSDIRASL